MKRTYTPQDRSIEASRRILRSKPKGVNPQVSLLYRSPSFVLVASMAGTAMDIENRAWCANKRPHFSLGIKNGDV